MSAAEVIAELEAVASRLDGASHEQAFIAHSSHINRALELTAGGLQPSADDLDTARQQWCDAAGVWDDSAMAAGAAGKQLAPIWSGTDATACQSALNRYSAAAQQPYKGCLNVAIALARLGDALAEPRSRVQQAREALSRLLDTGGPGAAEQARGEVSWLILQYRNAQELTATAAREVEAASSSLTPAQTLTTVAAPFAAAVTSLATARAAARTKEARRRRAAAALRRRRSARSKARSHARRATGPTSGARTRRSASSHRSASRQAPAHHQPARVRRVAGHPVRGVTGRRARVLSIMRRYEGIPYRWGGTTPRGFDCSGLVQYVYRQVGVRLPRTSGAQRRAGTVVSRREARPGDLVCMPGHVGIYLGNGMMYDAPRTGKTIGARRIWSDNYVLVRVLGN